MENSELLNEINERLKRIEERLNFSTDNSTAKNGVPFNHWSELDQPTGNHNYAPHPIGKEMYGNINYPSPNVRIMTNDENLPAEK